MISILIPVYNYDVKALVGDLLSSAAIADIPHQIIVMDDCSNNEYKTKNLELGQMMNVNYIELSENIGRSKIRNKLAKLARYEKLIFLDCDSQLLDDQFLSTYISNRDNSIIYGGRNYQSQKPQLEYMLHWKYGTEVESLRLSERSKNPVVSFLTNNFMCDASLFNKIGFNEKITFYGYEDLAFAYNLSKMGYYIKHINNSVIHVGLDKNDLFLKKQKHAIQSLSFLYNENLIPKTKLIKTYNLITKFALGGIFGYILSKTETILIKNLLGKNPKIYYLQLLKLYWFHQMTINKDTNI